MTNANSSHALKVEKTISKSPAEVFRAIGEGRLFMNCGADSESIKINFEVGGKYSILFVNHNMINQGEFLEIVPHTKIAFTWCQDYDSNPTPDTTVSIELKDLGGKTALTLTHSGFKDVESKDAHEGGWNGGLDDFSQEVANGKLRIIRKVPLTVEKLYEVCTREFEGETLEAARNQKLILRWNAGPNGEPVTRPTQLTLLLEADDEKSSSWLELIHEGLETESQKSAQRSHWDVRLKRLK